MGQLHLSCDSLHGQDRWLTAKDPDFLRKFNRTALEVIPWSFDGAVKKVLGEEQSIDALWEEYQLFFNKK